MMSKAKTPQDIDVAQSIYKRAEAFAQESMSIAQRHKDTLGQKDAEEAIEGVLQSELRGNEQLRPISKSRPSRRPRRRPKRNIASPGCGNWPRKSPRTWTCSTRRTNPSRAATASRPSPRQSGPPGIPKPDDGRQEVGGLRLAQLRLHEAQDARHDGGGGHEGRGPRPVRRRPVACQAERADHHGHGPDQTGRVRERSEGLAGKSMQEQFHAAEQDLQRQRTASRPSSKPTRTSRTP